MKWIMCMLLAVAMSAAEPTDFAAQFEQAAVGRVVVLPGTCPAEWTVYKVRLGEKTPDYDRWVAAGRLVWAYRPGEERRVVIARQTEDGQMIVFWSPVKLAGEGWRVSDQLPKPVVVAPVEIAVKDKDTKLEIAVDQAGIEQVIALPKSMPNSWFECRFSPAPDRWTVGMVGALTDGQRQVRFVVSTIEEGTERKARVWVRECDRALLTSRDDWRNARPEECSEKTPPVANPPLAQPSAVGESAPLMPEVPPPAKRVAPLPSLAPLPDPVVEQPTSANSDRAIQVPNWPEWVREPKMIDQLPLGSKVDVNGLDAYGDYAGWRLGLAANPSLEWQPGVVVGTPQGRAVVVSRKEGDGKSTRTVAGYWYRPKQAEAISDLPTADQLNTLAVGQRVTLPEGATGMAAPVGYVKVPVGPINEADRHRLMPGTVTRLFDQSGTVVDEIAAVVVAAEYREDGTWVLRLWAAARPDSKGVWRLRLPTPKRH